MFSQLKTYIIGITGIIIAALLVALLLYWGWYKDARAEAATANASLALALDVNKTNQATIARMVALNADANRILVGLNNSVAGITKTVSDSKETLATLKASNAEIQNYVRGIVPDDIRRLLNNGPVGCKDGTGLCAGSGSANEPRR